MAETTKASRPRAPKGLRSAASKNFWKAVLEAYELEPNELVLMREIVRVVDRLEALNDAVDRTGPLIRTGEHSFGASPALVEARQQQIVLGRLLATLRLPEDFDALARPQRRAGARGAYGSRRFKVASS